MQAALAVIVFHRGIARRYPAFAVLIVFYPLRAILLLALPRYAAAASSDVLSLAEILLEAWLVLELASRLIGEMADGTPRRIWIAALFLLAVLAGAGITLAAVPSSVPVDRTQVLFWWAALALGTAAVFRPRLPRRPTSQASADLQRICAGFAVFSLCQLLTLAGRAHAFAERSRHAYVAWSYVPAAAYIVVVMYWLVFLEPAHDSKPARAPA